LARRWLGCTSGRSRYRSGARQRGGMGTWLGVGRAWLGARLGSARLELRGVWRLHKMASGLGRLGLAAQASERVLVSRVEDVA
jgi:hypothetical protein